MPDRSLSLQVVVGFHLGLNDDPHYSGTPAWGQGQENHGMLEVSVKTSSIGDATGAYYIFSLLIAHMRLYRREAGTDGDNNGDRCGAHSCHSYGSQDPDTVCCLHILVFF